MRYVDGYVLPVPKKNVEAYRRMAKKAGKIWREHGALDYKECVGDDLNVECGVPFSRSMKLKSGETVVFAYIVFKSRAHRDRVNAKVMKDPRTGQIDGREADALRHEAHGLRRVQDPGRRLKCWCRVRRVRVVEERWHCGIGSMPNQAAVARVTGLLSRRNSIGHTGGVWISILHLSAIRWWNSTEPCWRSRN